MKETPTFLQTYENQYNENKRNIKAKTWRKKVR